MLLFFLPADVASPEVRFATMERQHNALSDELWGDELGLAKAQGLSDTFGAPEAPLMLAMLADCRRAEEDQCYLWQAGGAESC